MFEKPKSAATPERRLANRRLESRIADSRLDNSQRIARLGDWEYDFVHQRLLWSEGVYRILGLARNDAPPDSEIFYCLVHPDDLAFVKREKQAATEGLHRADFEHRIIRPDGEVRHVHHITETERDGEGRLVRESNGR